MCMRDHMMAPCLFRQFIFCVLICCTYGYMVVWFSFRYVDDMTRLDMIVLVHLCCCWCSYRYVELLGDGCPHDVSQLHLCMAKWAKSSMVVEFAWCCLYVGMLEKFIHLWKLHVHPSIQKHIFACFLIRPSANTSFHDFPFASTSLCMHHLFIHWRTWPSGCTPFVHPICCHTMFVCVPLSAITHDETTSNP